MASSDVKHDYNMEAGLLSTPREERIMEKETQSQDSEFAHTSQMSRNTSCTRRGLIALAVVSLVGVGLVSIGGGVCPNHLRHATAEDIRVKDAIHSHKPNLSDTMAQLARRQENNTPGASSSTVSEDVTTDSVTDSVTEPTTTAIVTETASTESTSSAVVTEPTTTSAESSQPSSSTNQVSSTETQETTTQQRSTSSQEVISSTEQSSSAETTTTADQTSTTVEETTTASQSSSQRESTTDSDEVSSTATESAKKTITTGTRTTSSAVPKTFTSTLENGGITTLTSTSWVAVVPSSESTGEPNLQNAAPQSSAPGFLYAIAGMMFGGMFLL
ncbi:hypothetical protein B0J13DRAFT_256491 [Dactylonectria estremocensis]|uniref:Uncharacterized protein n=1 Tax=Dactylonectria estremocensis TaxID=1079267 RepID=A0A9P9JB33_9HYPO|nr:hypothetical protein B0J13DRAFT_256491 [Dactylonectria estremocensis]